MAPTYDEAVRGPLQAMLEELASGTGGRVKMFRQNRDLRFARGAAPYKTRTYGVILEHRESRAPVSRVAVADDVARPELQRAVDALEGAGLEIVVQALKRRRAGIRAITRAASCGAASRRSPPRSRPTEIPRIAALAYEEGACKPAADSRGGSMITSPRAAAV